MSRGDDSSLGGQGWVMNTDSIRVCGIFDLRRAIETMARSGADQAEDAIHPLQGLPLTPPPRHSKPTNSCNSLTRDMRSDGRVMGVVITTQ